MATSNRGKKNTQQSDSVIVQAPNSSRSVRSDDFASSPRDSNFHHHSELSDSSGFSFQVQGHGLQNIGSQFTLYSYEVDPTLPTTAESSESQLGFCQYHSRILEESSVLRTPDSLDLEEENDVAVRHHDIAAHWIHSDSECWLAEKHHWN